MGIVVVLIVYAIGLTIFASAAAAMLGGVSFILLRRAPSDRKRAITVAVAFPFVCVLFAALWFVLYATINSFVMNRDPGLGDGWYTPLPNGYELNMIDTTDQGTVSIQGGMNEPNSEHGVRQLQVHGKDIFGAQDSGYFQRVGRESTAVDTWFALDTQTGRTKHFSSEAELTSYVHLQGLTLQLRPFDSVFRDYRNTWFDYCSFTVLFVLPLTGFGLLVRWIWKLRPSRSMNVYVETAEPEP